MTVASNASPNSHRLESQHQNITATMADVENESWRGFSIPDLWAPSNYWLEDDSDSKQLFPPLKFEGE